MDEAISFPGITSSDKTRWGLLQKKVQEQRAVRAFALFREHGIEPVLIKGLAAGRYYPQSHPRLFIDIDLAVPNHDFERAASIVRLAENEGLPIDLHRELRRHDTVDWDDLFANSQLFEIDGCPIRVLRPEDHLRVLCTHWLTDGGEYKEKLWDVYYLLDRRTSDFDWDRCLKSVSLTRRRWVVCTIGLAHRYLGLDLDDTPIVNEALDLPAWLTKVIETEWASDVRLVPSEVWLSHKRLWFQQIRKRFPPSPVQATVEMEGSFDAKTRIFYQIGNIFQRIAASYRRISERKRLRSK